MPEPKSKGSSNKRKKMNAQGKPNKRKTKQSEEDKESHSYDPTKASTPPAILQALKPLNSAHNQEIKSDKKRRKKKKKRWVLPLDQIRIGFYAWHCPVVKGLKVAARKCYIIEVSTDQNDYYPIKFQYLNETIIVKGEPIHLISGWTKPKYLEFDDKYKEFTITKGLRCWHRPVYRGIVLPPQQCIVSDIDLNDPVKNISIKYTDSEASVFGKIITFREGWINDRDLQFDCNLITAKQNFQVLQKLMEPDRSEQGRMCLKVQSTVTESDGLSTPRKNSFHVGATAYHRAVIEGKETQPLEITVEERDDEGTPRNCRIAYKEEEIKVCGQTHRLIGGWVSDKTLTAKVTVWMHYASGGTERRAREVRIMDLDTRDCEVYIEYVHHNRDTQPVNEILGGWVPARELMEVDVKEARILRRAKR